MDQRVPAGEGEQDSAEEEAPHDPVGQDLEAACGGQRIEVEGQESPEQVGGRAVGEPRAASGRLICGQAGVFGSLRHSPTLMTPVSSRTGGRGVSRVAAGPGEAALRWRVGTRQSWWSRMRPPAKGV